MDTSRSRILVLAALAALASMATGAAFAGWAHHGADIFLTMAASGLSWCF